MLLNKIFFTLYNNSFIKRYLVKKMIRIYRRDKPEFQTPIVRYLTQRWVLKRDFILISNYKKIHPEKIEYIFKEKKRLHYSNLNFYNSRFSNLLHCGDEKDNYCVVFRDVNTICGSNLIILDGKYVFYEFKQLVNNSNIDFTDHGVKFYKNDYLIIEANYGKEVFEEAVLFTGNYDSNLYHFIFEIIAKFEMLNKLNLPNQTPLLVNKNCLKFSQFVEILNLFNNNRFKIIGINHLEIYKVKKLYYLTCPNIIPPNYLETINIESNQNLFDLDNIAFLRNRFLEMVAPINTSKKIFISRKGSSERRKYNEKEVTNFLIREEFQTINPAEHSMAEQISIFNNAEIIVGATGAAFSNILFCNKNCKIICLTNYKIDISIFSTLASFVEVNMTYLFDKKLKLEKSSDIHSDFSIDINELREALNN